MLQIIILLIVVIVVWNLLKKLALSLFKIALVIIGGCLYLCFWNITIPLTIVAVLLFFLANGIKSVAKAVNRIKTRKNNRMWMRQCNKRYTEEQIDSHIYNAAQEIKDQNKDDYKFFGEQLPYGRISAFLNYFGESIYTTEPYYFSSVPSRDDNEFREYGLLLTRNGIYVSLQGKGEQFLPFAGLKEVKAENGNFVGCVVTTSFDDNIITLQLPSNTVDANELVRFCTVIISGDINRAMFNDKVVDGTDTKSENAEKYLDAQLEKSVGKRSLNASVLPDISRRSQDIYQEVKNSMNGFQGHGYAAEYGNNMVDRLKLKDVKGQQVDEYGRPLKGGADRIVDGVEIQTKYYKTARESVAAAFDEDGAIYIRQNDNSGKMQKIEVPREQYEAAKIEMQKRIDNGEVPNVAPGESAKDYVGRGHVTYEQAKRITSANTVEGLFVDTMNGVVCSLPMVGISSILAFSQAVWSGDTVEDAAAYSIKVGLVTLGKGTLLYTIPMQFSRKEATIPFLNTNVHNPMYDVTEGLANYIRQTDFAKSTAGKKLGIDKVTGKAVSSFAVGTIVLYGPDVMKSLQGRISVDQLLKNSVVTAISAGAAVFGEQIVPVIGGVVGGMAGGFIAKNVLDQYVEDDAKRMFRILKEEFLDGVMIIGLNQEEFEEVIQLTVKNPKLTTMLENMYASGEAREYAKEAIVGAAITEVLSKRKKITVEDYYTGLAQLVSA